MAEMGTLITLDGVAVHPNCWCLCLCYLYFAPENPDGEMYLLVPAQPGCPGQSPESCKMVMCVCANVIKYESVDWIQKYIKQRRIMLQTHTHTQPFYGSLEFVRDNPGEPVPEETFTHYTHRGHQSSLSVFSIYYDTWHPPHSIHVLYSLFPQSLSKFSLVYLLAWYPPLHTPYISSPNHCLLFAAHAHTIATCSATKCLVKLSSYLRGNLTSSDRI